MNFKKSIRKIHLWLGLASGIIVFIVAITGCLYAFQEEILNLTETYKKVEKQEQDFLLPSQLKGIGQQQLPHKHIHAVQYRGKEQAAEVIFYNVEPLYYDICYINPYTGEVLQTVNELSGFFRFILDGHFYLWLPEKIGQTVIASATLIFVLLILSGFILWFPKNKKAVKQRFWFQWKNTTKWKRKNYDVHNITGFYVLSLALIFAVTGLVWGFPWFAYSYYTVIGGEKSLVYEEPVFTKTDSPLIVENPLDKVWIKMLEEYPNAFAIEVHPPEKADGIIAANANLGNGTYWQTDYRYFDYYTLEEKEVEHIYGKLDDATLSDKIIRMNYDIHTGAILGLPGKIFAFLVSLLIASLPITGFLIWWGKRNKKI